MGNLGAALSHISIWKHLAKTSRSALIFEDNALFRADSMQKVNKSIRMFPKADFINFAVLRPRGIRCTDNICLVRTPERLHEPFPNVWHSSYFISSRGAAHILDFFAHQKYDFNTKVIDWMASLFWSMSNRTAAYIASQPFFGHVQSPQDSRSKLNDLHYEP